MVKEKKYVPGGQTSLWKGKLSKSEGVGHGLKNTNNLVKVEYGVSRC